MAPDKDAGSEEPEATLKWVVEDLSIRGRSQAP
jgi:hypothetical protein